MSHLNVQHHFHEHPTTDFSFVLLGSYVVGYVAGRVIGLRWIRRTS
ncbi:hypothetical protein ACFQ0K_18370 [Nocardioides caeni]|nr:hypothetical protein [Nocardioides caeni]